MKRGGRQQPGGVNDMDLSREPQETRTLSLKQLHGSLPTAAHPVVQQCPLHGQLLQSYCLTDRACVCQTCAAGVLHCHHEVVSVQEAQTRLGLLLSVRRSDLDLDHRAGLCRARAERARESKEAVRAANRQLRESATTQLDAAITALGQYKVEVLAAIEEEHRRMEDNVQENLQTLANQEEVVQTAQHSVEQALAQTDPFLFAWGFSAVERALKEAEGLNLGPAVEQPPQMDRARLRKRLDRRGARMQEQWTQLQSSLISLVDPQSTCRAVVAAAPPTPPTPLTPPATQHLVTELTLRQTIPPGVFTISCDLKSASLNVKIHRAQTVNRPTVLAEKFFPGSGGMLCWQVKLHDDCDWTVGVFCAYITNGYGLRYSNSQYKCVSPAGIQLLKKVSYRPAEEVLEVRLDQKSGRLSFYTVRWKFGPQILAELTISDTHKRLPVIPYFTLEKSDADILSPFCELQW
ncbi:uncharacterized protein [Lepisosteus oculatus]|uniref:uncharacterized protein n=1 Tax=Lepisosteus oculatus TaxID=7918 RepID=UPI0037218D73